MSARPVPRAGWRAALAASSLLALLAAAALAAGPGAKARPAAATDAAAPASPAAYDSTMGDSLGEGRLFLSWGAPWGMPGARRNVDWSCADTSRVDTLYLSFESGRDLPRFLGMFAYLDFRPAAGDSLGTYWDFSHTGANAGGLKLQLDPDGSFPCSQPFVRPGMAAPKYEYDGARSRLFLGYAVRLQDPGPIAADTRYCFARLLFERRHCAMPGGVQPACIEWEKAEYSGGGRDILITTGDERFVTVNSPDGRVCAPYRRGGRPAPWVPPAPPRPAVRVVPGPSDTTTRR